MVRTPRLGDICVRNSHLEIEGGRSSMDGLPLAKLNRDELRTFIAGLFVALG